MDEKPKGVPIDLIVSAVATIATAYAMLWILRHPDAGRTLNMRACLLVRRSAQASADTLQKIADDAGTRYNALRNVVT